MAEVDLATFIRKYGTEGTSILLRSLARQLNEKHGDIDMAVVNDIATDLHSALKIYYEDHRRSI